MADRTWSGGQWIARFERNSPKPRLLMIPEPGWPAPDLTEGNGHSLHLDGSAYVEDHGSSRKLNAAQLLEFYLAEGEAFLRRVRGSFAILVWSAADATLLCVRDPIGTHPLFYAPAGTDIEISPSLDALIRSPKVSNDVDPRFLAARLLLLSGRPEDTFFSAVRRLPAGHALRLDVRTLRISRFWTPDAELGQSDMSPAEVADRFRELLRGAVGRSLEGGRGAIFLSGGLDSSTVAACAADVSREERLPPPIALSFLSPDPAANEEETQRLVAHRLGLPLVTMGADAPGGRSLLASALAFNQVTAGLMASPLAPVYDELVRRAEIQGAEAILTGDGGDEWILPRPEYLADRMLALDVRSFSQLARAWYGFYPVYSKLDFAQGVLWKWGGRKILRAATGSALQRYSAQRLRAIRRRRFLEDLPPWLAPGSNFRARLTEWVIDLQPERRPAELYARSRDELLYHPNVAEHCEGAYAERRRRGVPIRSPLMDADLVAFLFNVPPSHLVYHGQAKWLARRLLTPQLGGLVDSWPRTVYGDGFFTQVMSDEAPGAWRDLGGARLLTELGVVDGAKLDSIFREAASSGAPLADAERLWHIMTLESWLRPRLE